MNFLNYEEKVERLKKEVSEIEILQKRLKNLNTIVEELIEEYKNKQKQISLFLECKKTFLGRVKYYFKKNKTKPVVKKEEKPRKIKRLEKDEELKALYERKEQYTIEDLINLCTKLEEKVKRNNNISLDIKATANKKDIISKKVENADLYIKEIDSHKKSIFDFWKFTNKDVVQTLNEGEEIEEENQEKIEKYFDYENDLEDLGKKVDEIQRRKLSNNETDAIFIAKQVNQSINELSLGKEDILEKDLNLLKEEYDSNIEYINVKDFDIFGGLSDDKTKIKTINNEKHREVEKSKFKVLKINENTTLDEFKTRLEEDLKYIDEAFNKIKSPYNMSVYKVVDSKDIQGINLFEINPKNEIENILKNSRRENIKLYRLNIKENTPAIFYSNIMFYDNFNQTLPLGMNLSSEVLIDMNKLKVNKECETEFNMNYSVDEFKNKTIRVTVYEYSIYN